MLSILNPNELFGINAEGVTVAKTGALKLAVHTFSGLADGQYRIRLKSANGYTTEKSLSIAAGIDLNAGFEIPKTTVQAGEPIQFKTITIGHDITYNWNFGDGTEVKGTAEPEHSYVLPSLYKVTLKQSKGFCHKLSEQNIIVRSGLAMGIEDDIVSRNFSLFPNPANETVTISLNQIDRSEHPGLIEIYDAIGRMVMRIEKPDLTDEGRIILPIKELANGSYSLTISSGKNRYTRMFVIAH